MKKVLVISTGAYPVPAIKGGAVETLTTHYLRLNESDPTFEFYHIGYYSEGVDSAVVSYTLTHFVYIHKTLLRKIKNACWKILERLSHGKMKRNVYTSLMLDEAMKIKPDVVVLESAMAIAKNIKTQLPETIVYAHIHNVVSDEFNGSDIDRYIDGYLCISRFICESTRHLLNVDKGKVKLLYNCVDTSRFTPLDNAENSQSIRQRLNIPQDAFLVVFTGRIQPYKGIMQLVKAMYSLSADTYLMVVGESFFSGSKSSPFMEKLKEEASKCNDRIRFTGFISQDKLAHYYCAADIAVIPSTWEEPFGLTCAEALACGLPVIITKVGGLPEIVNQDCALTVDNDNRLVESLASSIDALHNDEDLRRSMGYNARKRAMSFDINNYWKTFKNIINEA